MNLAAEVILEARIDSLERENATLRAQLAAYQTATTIPAPPIDPEDERVVDGLVARAIEGLKTRKLVAQILDDDDLPSPREAMTGARE